MKLKWTLFLLLCSVFAISSCSDDDVTEKKTVSISYRILVSADVDYQAGTDGGGIEELYQYTNNEMEAVSKKYNKEIWTITETAETEKDAIAACDKKAIALFEGNLSDINTACASLKTKFETKKTELLSKIKLDSSDAYLIYKNYGGHLLKKATEDELFPSVIVKEGTLIDFQALGGEQ